MAGWPAVAAVVQSTIPCPLPTALDFHDTALLLLLLLLLFFQQSVQLSSSVNVSDAFFVSVPPSLPSAAFSCPTRLSGLPHRPSHRRPYPTAAGLLLPLCTQCNTTQRRSSLVQCANYSRRLKQRTRCSSKCMQPAARAACHWSAVARRVILPTAMVRPQSRSATLPRAV